MKRCNRVLSPFCGATYKPKAQGLAFGCWLQGLDLRDGMWEGSCGIGTLAGAVSPCHIFMVLQRSVYSPPSGDDENQKAGLWKQ